MKSAAIALTLCLLAFGLVAPVAEAGGPHGFGRCEIVEGPAVAEYEWDNETRTISTPDLECYW